MKVSVLVLLVLLLVVPTGCREQRPDQGPRMVLDSAASGQNVALVQPKEALRPSEGVVDSRPAVIVEADVDALRQTPSKGVVYVKRGQAVHPAENRQ